MLTDKDWRDIKFWTTHDERFLSVREMHTPHLINIIRQIINLACEHSDIEPIPIKTPLALIDFEARDDYEWVALCKVLYDECRLRLSKGEPLSTAYLEILSKIHNRIWRLSTKELSAAPDKMVKVPIPCPDGRKDCAVAHYALLED